MVFIKGQRVSPNTEFKKGMTTWNKGLTKELDSRLIKSKEAIEKQRAKLKGKMPKNFAMIKSMPVWNKGKKATEEHKRHISEGGIGRIHSLETRRKIGDSHRGEKCYNWLGGISREPYSIDWTKTLKKSIRERDRYICQICNGEGLDVHHIDYNKKNCNLNNLITLCRSCHMKTGGNRNKWIEYFKERVTYG